MVIHVGGVLLLHSYPSSTAGYHSRVKVGAGVGASEVTSEVDVNVRADASSSFSSKAANCPAAESVLVVVVSSVSTKALPIQSSFAIKLNFVSQHDSGYAKTCVSRSGGSIAHARLPIS